MVDAVSTAENAIFINSGIRSMERGTVSTDRDADGC